MFMQLTSAERRTLKARAHALEPTVVVGSAGMTPAVIVEIERSLAAHELIKIRILGDDRAVREHMLERICNELGAAPIQHIGKVLVVYRAKTEVPVRPKAKLKQKPPRPLKRTFQNRA